MQDKDDNIGFCTATAISMKKQANTSCSSWALSIPDKEGYKLSSISYPPVLALLEVCVRFSLPWWRENRTRATPVLLEAAGTGRTTTNPPQEQHSQADTGDTRVCWDHLYQCAQYKAIHTLHSSTNSVTLLEMNEIPLRVTWSRTSLKIRLG